MKVIGMSTSIQCLESFPIVVAPNSSPIMELLDPITEVQENSSHQFNVSTSDAENDDINVKWEQVSEATVFMTNSEAKAVLIDFPQVDDNFIVELKVTANDRNSESSLVFFVEIINQVENVTPPTVNKSKSGDVFNFYLLILLIFVLSKIRMIYN
jgi:hypothetical protein